MFVRMKLRPSYKAILDSDITTYILIGIVLLTILIGGIKIIFF